MWITKSIQTILTTRLKKILIQIIHQVQVGFLPKRYLRNNVKMILNVLEQYQAHLEKQLALVLIFLDAQKAFDNINWSFLLLQNILMLEKTF